MSRQEMQYEEAVATVARERGCSPDELVVCSEGGVHSCTESECRAVAELMKAPTKPLSAIPESAAGLVTKCVMVGEPPEGYDSWQAWFASPVKTGAYLRAATVDDWERPAVPPKPLPVTRSNVLPDDDTARLDYPMADGLLYYFPAALAEVARVSKLGKDQHNPGLPLHWARNKSTDHENKILRHLLESGTKDSKGVRHTARLAWRALALLQIELEREEGAPLPRNAY